MRICDELKTGVCVWGGDGVMGQKQEEGAAGEGRGGWA